LSHLGYGQCSQYYRECLLYQQPFSTILPLKTVRNPGPALAQVGLQLSDTLCRSKTSEEKRPNIPLTRQVSLLSNEPESIELIKELTGASRVVASDSQE